AKQKINKASLNSGAFLCAALSQSPCVNYDLFISCSERTGRIKNNESTVWLPIRAATSAAGAAGRDSRRDGINQS
ncbi:hypothetical protein Q4S24_18700, partial [Morganella morganii]